MPGLATIGLLQYNGIRFDSAAKVRVQTDYPLDDAGRSILYQRYTITVNAIVAPGNGPADGSLEAIRSQLGEPARAFTFTGCGFGNDLELPMGADVAGGPIPKILSWESIGSNYAAEIEWQVVVCVPSCRSQSPGKGGVLAINYEQTFAIDEHGDTTRVTTGYLQIAQNRNGRRPKDTADAYLNRIAVKQPEGFARQLTRSLSLDKSRVDFTVIDRQIPSPNAYPPNMTAIEGRHSVRWSRMNGGAMTLRNTIRMSVRPKAGISGSVAWMVFGEIVRKRLLQAIGTPPIKGRTVLLDELELEEDLFGRPCNFAVGYRITGCLCDILKDTGLWQPIGTTWAKWHESLPNVQNWKGTAQIGHRTSDDIIVDFCGGGSLLIDQTQTNIPQPKPTYATFKNDPDKIPEDGGYISYSNTIIPSRHRPVTRQSIVQPPDDDKYGAQSITANAPAVYPPSQGYKDTIQEGGTSRYTVHMVGSAVRAGKKIPKPTLIQAGSSGTPREVSSQFAQTVIGTWFCVPIYRAEWAYEYAIDGSPGRVDPKENPRDCIDEKGNAKG